MSRINRRKWSDSDFGDKNTKGIFGLVDMTVKSNFRITDDEYDHICDIANDEELDLIVTEKPTFPQRRKMIEFLNKNINYE